MIFNTDKVEGQIGDSLELKDSNNQSFAVIREMQSFNKTLNRITNIAEKKEIIFGEEQLVNMTDLEVLENIIIQKEKLVKGGLHKLQISKELQERLKKIFLINIPLTFISGTMHSYSPLKLFEIVELKISESEKVA